MKTLLQWLLVPLSAIAVWYATLLLGLVGYSALDGFCPPELMVSGACTAPWHAPAVDAWLLVCTAIASFGIVIVPALVAPLQRFRVALTAFGCGAAFAIYVASSGGFWPPFVVSAAGGSAGLWVAASRLKPGGIAR